MNHLDQTLSSPPAPAEETLRFNAALEKLLAGAPPPGAVSAAQIRALRAEGRTALPVGGPLPEGAWAEYDAERYGAPGGLGRVRLTGLDLQTGLLEDGARPTGILIHIHGGGWTIGAADQADKRNLRIRHGAGIGVISLAYRLAPEHPWPACFEDCLAGARFALDQAEAIAAGHGLAAADLPVFIGGESAGAHLAALVLLALREEGRLARFAGAVLTYGCFDMRMTPSTRNWGERNLVLSTPVVDWFLENVLGSDRSIAETPEVSPLLADLSGMPPALFQVGDEDPLYDDTAFMAARWKAAGAAARVVVWPGGVHAFDYFDEPQHDLPIALESQDLAIDWLKERLTAAD